MLQKDGTPQISNKCYGVYLNIYCITKRVIDFDFANFIFMEP